MYPPGWFDKGVAGFENTLGLRIFYHTLANAILDAASCIEELALY